MALTAKQILSLNDRPLKEVEVPEWGGSVFIRVLSARERAELQAFIAADGTVPLAAIVALSCVDADGERLFAEADLEALGDKNAQALERIVNAVLRLNVLTPESAAEAGKD